MRDLGIRNLTLAQAAILLLAVSAAAEAQPAIASTSGQWLQNATVTITGSGFGTNSIPKPDHDTSLAQAVLGNAPTLKALFR